MFTGVKLLRYEPERFQPVYGIGKIWYHVVRHDTAPKRSGVRIRQSDCGAIRIMSLDHVTIPDTIQSSCHYMLQRLSRLYCG